MAARAVRLTGCATPRERQTAAARAAVRFAEGARRADGPRGCAALAPRTRQEIEQSAGSPCAQPLPEERLPYGGARRDVEVHGRQAQVVSVCLRQRGSPASQPVGAARTATGVEG
ncbi:hypothetical protein CFC35_27100 [Streptomyces sp. FBKL.4005]|uniref:hypothetical protein n=1 Tax=Streptomyces sp. FBKL.4005 TaxID=2015515 RepID=UPI000B97A20D|nr:hypothetical protein [Streptomyces sp. FBKL.4005]OYP17716.1 hypothetical protein CFC35_27100 [Streptomyces sp. FBKL.4005]